MGRPAIRAIRPEPPSEVEQARLRLAECRAIEAKAHADTLTAEGAYEALLSRQMPRLLTTEQVAQVLQVTPVTVRTLKQRGKLPCVQVGESTPRFREQDVLTFLEAAR